MKYMLPIVILAAFYGSSSSANPDLTRCIEIESSIDRLACYDDLAGYGSKNDEGARDSGDWIVRTETSIMDDSENVFLTLNSNEQTNCPFQSGSHSIHIACRENETNLWIYFGGCFMSSIQGRGQVTYRLDADEAKLRNFRASNNNMALGLWNGGSAIRFVKEMIGHNRMVIRATPFSDSTVTSQFNITGLEQAVQPVREACSW